ncbi:FHA domain-containing protein [Prosthecobacter sp.]|uniref:FHA domain-containing protein n=1 Tax=Prosthecobacter sp. TaxID=1965333 RepID=UPI00378532CA
MAKLTFVLEDGQEIVVPLAEHITLGRGEDNDVVVDDERVSKRHAELVLNADGTIQLFDSGSTAGTFVNGERVRSRTIRHGDSLAFGPLTAVLDLEEHTANGANGASPALELLGSDTQVVAISSPVKAGKVGTRKKNRGGRRDLASEEQMARQQAEHKEAVSRFEAEKARLQNEVAALQKEMRDSQEKSAAERAMHLARVESLRAEEQRLAPVKAALQEAEAAHAEWLQSIQTLDARHAEQTAALQLLASQHAQKTSELQHLTQDQAAARSEIEGLAAHREQALAHLQQIRGECAHDETVLDDLRRQLAELESRSQHSKEIADVREDQVKTAEKKLEQLSQQRAQLEAHIHDLTGIEEKLMQTRAQCREAEAQQAALTAAIAALGQDQQRSAAAVRDLESRIITLQASQQDAAKATAEAVAARKHAEDSLRHTQEELAAREKDLATRKTELAEETRRLAETQARRTELDHQCQELADTGQKLAGMKSDLAAAGQQLAGANTDIASAESQITEKKAALKALSGDETAIKGRIEVLHARENDLRAELAQLAAAERTQRTRFEEVRQLVAEVEKEHAARQQQLTSELETARRDLADILSRLQPLRDWKEAMDQLYARLATLPQDSPEARDLWHEIEKEKAGLHELITTARTQAHAATPGAAHGGSSPRSAPPAETFPRPRVGGAAQELTLRSRLSHLRENVQREESRLEQLRLERTRHESPHRSNLAAEAMLREQSRHLEAKIRQEQERHHALLHNIELSQAEEEKRRERLCELEHRLAELRTDIVEAERQRGELRQQADLAHTELKNFEAALDRLSKKTAD